MPAVQVRDLPQRYYDMLKGEAKTCGRSINRQLEVIVKAHFDDDIQAGGATCAVPAKAAASFAERLATPDEAEIAARVEKRRRLFARVDGRKLPDFPDDMDPASVIRQMRDER